MFHVYILQKTLRLIFAADELSLLDKSHLGKSKLIHYTCLYLSVTAFADNTNELLFYDLLPDKEAKIIAQLSEQFADWVIKSFSVFSSPFLFILAT